MGHHSHNGKLEAELLQEVQAHLDAGRPDRALDMLHSTGNRSKALLNAYGVCLMRAGQIDKASGVFRNLAISGNGFCLDPRAPIVFTTNYAIALLLAAHVNGCMAVLNQIENQAHPAVVRLRNAIDAWKRTLGRVRRLLIPVLGLPDVAVPLPFPPGDIWIKGNDGPPINTASRTGRAESPL